MEKIERSIAIHKQLSSEYTGIEIRGEEVINDKKNNPHLFVIEQLSNIRSAIEKLLIDNK
jgi:aryl-phospho-beta-D-glucosidase BglC (GH1 family)